MEQVVINSLTKMAPFSVAMVRKSALSLIVIWGMVLAIACWFAIDLHIGNSLRVSNSWQLLFISALFAPAIAYYVIIPLLTYHPNNSEVGSAKFVRLNLGQLKIYIIGMALTMLMVGVAVVMLAAVWGLLLNSFLLISGFFRENI